MVFLGDRILLTEEIQTALSEEFKMERVDFTNEWVDGLNSAMLYSIQKDVYLYPSFPQIKPGDLVIISAGIYDAKYSGATDPAGATEAMLSQFLDETEAQGISVLILTIPEMINHDNFPPTYTWADPTLTAVGFYNDLIERSIHGQNTRLIDTNSILQTSDFELDGYHVSPIGVETIINATKEAIE